MRIRTSVAVLAIAAVLTGCASNPRGFSPVMASAPANQAAFEVAFNVCSQQVAEGRRSSFRSGREASATAGIVVGGAAAATSGAVASGAGALGAVAGSISAAATLAVVAPLAIVGMSMAQRANKERQIRNAMTTCLAEDGYQVSDWELVRGEPTGPTSPTRAAPRA